MYLCQDFFWLGLQALTVCIFASMHKLSRQLLSNPANMLLHEVNSCDESTKKARLSPVVNQFLLSPAFQVNFIFISIKEHQHPARQCHSMAKEAYTSVQAATSFFRGTLTKTADEPWSVDYMLWARFWKSLCNASPFLSLPFKVPHVASHPISCRPWDIIHQPSVHLWTQCLLWLPSYSQARNSKYIQRYGIYSQHDLQAV